MLLPFAVLACNNLQPAGLANHDKRCAGASTNTTANQIFIAAGCTWALLAVHGQGCHKAEKHVQLSEPQSACRHFAEGANRNQQTATIKRVKGRLNTVVSVAGNGVKPWTLAVLLWARAFVNLQCARQIDADNAALTSSFKHWLKQLRGRWHRCERSAITGLAVCSVWQHMRSRSAVHTSLDGVRRSLASRFNCLLKSLR